MSNVVNCPLCGERSARVLWQIDGFDIVRCRGCSLAYVANPLSPEESKDLYCSDYLGEVAQVNYSAKAGIRDPFGRLYYLNRERMRAVERVSKVGTLLDVGCGRGFFLLTARGRGWEVQGIDISQSATEYARQRYDLDVITGELTDGLLPPNSYDVITLWHVLEHLPHPLLAITEIEHILKPGGRLFVEVPNVDDLLLHLGLRHYRGGNHPRYHRQFFSRRTLALLLEKGGFHQCPIGKFHYSSSFTLPLKVGAGLVKRALSLADRDSVIRVMAMKANYRDMKQITTRGD